MKNLAKQKTSWFNSGSPWIWLNGGAVAICMLMVLGLLGLIAVRGFGHFWPADIAQTSIVDRDGQRQLIMGEAVRDEVISAAVARDGGYKVEADVELRSEEHTSELQLRENLVCRLLLEKKKKYQKM